MTQPIVPTAGTAVSVPADQEALWFLGALSLLRISGAQTRGAFAIAETCARHGTGSPVHVHDADDETFLVLDGELRILVGGDEHHAGPGAVAVLPRRVPHAYVVTSPAARFLVFHTPSGFEEFVRDVGEPARTLTLPPVADARPDVDEVTRMAAQHGIAIVGPPPVAARLDAPRSSS